MSVWALTAMVALVAALGVLGGAATRYERHGPAEHRGPAGALAVVSLILAVTVALVVFGLAAVQGDGTVWRLVGVACTAGLFGGLIAARGVDHYLVLRSVPGALRGLHADGRRLVTGLRSALARLPWPQISAALSGTAYRRDRSRP